MKKDKNMFGGISGAVKYILPVIEGFSKNIDIEHLKTDEAKKIKAVVEQMLIDFFYDDNDFSTAKILYTMSKILIYKVDTDGEFNKKASRFLEHLKQVI